MGYKTTGNALAEWDDALPLVFTLLEDYGKPDVLRSTKITINLSDLLQGFSEDFLLHLKELIIEWRNRISIPTIESYTENLQNLFRRIINLQLFDAQINIIDETFLLGLTVAVEEMTATQLSTLKLLFLTAPHSPIWAPRLHADLFPKIKNKKGAHGRQISRILAKALTRSACVHILSQCEQAYDAGRMDIGLFAFTNLAFSVFCRPESYRQIQLRDLVIGKTSNEHFIFILPKKTRIHNPDKIAYKINEPLAILLQKQRQSVVNKYAHLVDPQDVDKIALFPATGVKEDKSAWLHEHANEHFGMYEKAEHFTERYPRRIQNSFLSGGLTIGANVLRHTLGTQLAQTGASARTIQAVLKHASDTVCSAYVDIAFHGLIDVLSDAMEPSFETHLPAFSLFRSKNDPINAEKAIHSDNMETGKIELTGECGKLIQCEYAPITCYGCVRFIPCWDADHSVNLAIVEREIKEYKQSGKPFQPLIEKARLAKNQIILVMNAADRYQQECMSRTGP